MQEWIVESKHNGFKLLNFLVEKLDNGASSRFIKKAIENNCCQINGRTQRFASTIVGQGDKITFIFTNFTKNKVVQFDQQAILFEDDDLFIYNKPSGINCDQAGIVKVVSSYNNKLILLHRLDRDTTGLLIFVKNANSHAHLLEQFKNRKVKKCYRTLVDGVVKSEQGFIDNKLDKKKILNGQTIWGAVKIGGLTAITSWKRLNSSAKTNASLLHCFPRTGRTHQIRVHMSEMGHPILGDHQYGKQFVCIYQPGRYLLHAEQLSFIHPKTDKILNIQAPIPEDFKQAELELFS